MTSPAISAEDIDAVYPKVAQIIDRMVLAAINGEEALKSIVRSGQAEMDRVLAGDL